MKAFNVTPIVRIPEDLQLPLMLIKEELKSRKLFTALNEAGLYNCYFQPHLDFLILRSVGLDDGTDETFAEYDKIIQKRSRKIDADYDGIMKQALKVYAELQAIKKARKKYDREQNG